MLSAFVPVLLLLLVSGCCRQPVDARPPFRTLEDFEREDALDAWQLRQLDAAVEVDSASAHRRARLTYRKWTPGSSKWPSARLALGDGIFDIEDWRDFSSLKFDAWHSHARAIPLKIRIDDADGRRSVALTSVAARQRTTCEIPLRQLAADIDLAHISKIDLYMTQPMADREIGVDEIRLEAGALVVVEEELSVDPFGAGRFSAKVGFNRRALASIEVVRDESGTVIRQFGETASQLSWQHDGVGLQPGRYRVRLRATELPDSSTAIESTAIERHLGSFEVLPPSRQPELVAWTEPSTRKVLLHSRPAAGQVVYDLADSNTEGLAPARLEMARNEHEAIQVVLLSRTQPLELSVAVGELRRDGTASVLDSSSAEVFQVGYVETEQPEDYAVEFAGWWPDALLPKDSMAALPGECMPVWISLRTTKEMEPGTYSGSVRMEVRRQEGAVDWQLPLEVIVHEATLPDTTTMRTAFSLRRFMLDRIYGERRARALDRQYRDFVAAHRLNVTDLYRNSVPALDEVASGAGAGTLNAFNLIQLSSDDADSVRLEEISAHLDPFVSLLEELGIVDRAYIYGFDEVTGDDEFEKLKRVFGYFKDRYPEVRTITTARDPSFGIDTGLSGVVDVWVPSMAYFDPAAAAEARAAGSEVWWYVYISPPHPFANWFVEYSALEARLLWWMSYQQGVTGFLYYYLNRWPNQETPLSLGDPHNRTNWNPASFGTANGDGCLIYAGPDGPISTLRLENIRDGIEDFELLHMLAARRGDGGAESRALCSSLVENLTSYTDDPKLFAETRSRLLRTLDEP